MPDWFLTTVRYVGVGMFVCLTLVLVMVCVYAQLRRFMACIIGAGRLNSILTVIATVSVVGVLFNGVGYGTPTVKKVGSVPVLIK